MNRQPDGIRKYRTAHDRFLKEEIINFFNREFSGYFSPIICENIAEALVELFNQHAPQTDRIKHGQMLWNALDRTTRADSSHRKHKAVVLSMVTHDDIALFEKQVPMPKIREQVVANYQRSLSAGRDLVNERYHIDADCRRTNTIQDKSYIRSGKSNRLAPSRCTTRYGLYDHAQKTNCFQTCCREKVNFNSST